MADEKSKKSKYIFLFLRIAVITAIVIWAASRMGQEQRWSSFLEYFSRMNVWALVGVLGIFTVGHMIVGFRWWLLLRSQSIFIDFLAAIRLYFLGWFYNNFMPSSVGGDLVRAWYVTKHTDKRFEAALSVFVDRMIGLASTLVIAIFFYTLFLRGKGFALTTEGQGGLVESIANYKWIILWVLVGILSVFCGVLSFKAGRKKAAKVWSTISVGGLRMIGKLKDAGIIYCGKPLTILAVFGLTVLMQLMVITGFWFLGRSMGITASIKYYYVFFTLTWVLGAIPISIGGAGVIEGLLVILFVRFAHIDEPAAWAIALSQRAVWMVTSLPGAVIHLFGAHLPKDFSIDYEEGMN